MPHKSKFLITSALPYANGPLHIGHIAGAYLPADIFVKYQKLKQNDIVYICGTDEYGVPIIIKSKEKKISPKKLVEENHKNIKNSFANLNINFDYFSGTSSNIHNKLSQSFFTNLEQNQYLEVKEEQQLYCSNDKMFLPDRYVIGICPNCLFEYARGDECIKCNAWLESSSLKSPKCKLCNKTPEMKTTKHWYLKLDKFENNLYKYIKNNINLKKNVKQYSLNWLKKGLHSRAITRDLVWGVPVPKENIGNKVLYVWFDAPIGYISITKEWSERIKKDMELWKEYWKNDNAKVIHFIGKDNIPFHSLFFPAILIGQKENYNLPENIIANEHLSIEGEKLSTSSGNVIWVDDFLKIFPADYLRYYLNSVAPENKDTNFSWKHFQEKINSELNNSYGNFVNRTLSFIDRYLDKNIPYSNNLTEKDKEYLKIISSYPKKISSLIENYKFKDALYKIIEIAELGNKYFESEKPWSFIKTDINRCKSIIYCSLRGVYISAFMLYPFIPTISEKIWSMIGEKRKINEIYWDDISETKIESKKVKEINIIINKIDDNIINTLTEKVKSNMIEEKINSNLESNKQVSKKLEEKKEESQENYINIDDFSKINIKIAKIINCEKINKSKKLLKFQVDLGTEQRQIVSGIAESYSPEELIGKQVLVVTNLAKIKLMNEVSEGMILSAQQDDKKIILISPDKPIKEGSSVS